jgi:hypothetical protein
MKTWQSFKSASLGTKIGYGITAYNVGTDLYEKWKVRRDSKNTYTLTIDEGAFIYNELLVWVGKQVKDARNFRILSKSEGVQRLLDNENTVEFEFEGHSVRVSQTQEAPAPATATAAYMPNSVPGRSLSFLVTERAAISKLERLMNQMTIKVRHQIAPLNLYRWGRNFWDDRELPKRDINSVILREGQKEALLADIERFLESEERYLQIGLPWHRGYLLYGEPGNGKTSLGLALANRLSLDLYTCSLSSIRDDDTLTSMFSTIDNKSILLLEDVDIFANAMSRENHGESGPTLAGLLNCLDGVHTPHGLITIMTTNRVDALDSALVRPGRMDFKMELLPPDNSQVERTYQHIYGRPLGGPPRAFESMAALMDAVKQAGEDADRARQLMLAQD